MAMRKGCNLYEQGWCEGAIIFRLLGRLAFVKYHLKPHVDENYYLFRHWEELFYFCLIFLCSFHLLMRLSKDQVYLHYNGSQWALEWIKALWLFTLFVWNSCSSFYLILYDSLTCRTTLDRLRVSDTRILDRAFMYLKIEGFAILNTFVWWYKAICIFCYTCTQHLHTCENVHIGHRVAYALPSYVFNFIHLLSIIAMILWKSVGKAERDLCCLYLGFSGVCGFMLLRILAFFFFFF